jgi:hypothetical protein
VIGTDCDAATITDAERSDPKGWGNLVADLTAVVIGMPLAKLQKFGDGRNAVEDRFIYDFRWAEEVKRPTVERIGFDDRLYLRPGVGEWLVRLTPLLRPLVETKWTKRVAERNPSSSTINFLTPSSSRRSASTSIASVLRCWSCKRQLLLLPSASPQDRRG